MTLTSHTRRFVSLMAGACALALTSLPALSAEITVRHAQGEVVLPETPTKVISFDLATIDTLDALGVTVAGVPKAPMPAYLKKYEGDDVEKVGSLFEPDYEAIAAAEPDLIVVSGRSAPKFAELAKIAPTIDLSVKPTDFFAASKANIETLGRIVGKEAEAKALIDGLNASTASLKEKTKGAGTGLLVLTTGGKMSTYGPGSRFGAIFDDYGMVPADAAIKADGHGQPISFEYILEKNPDWLFVIDRDAAIGGKGEAAAKLLDNDIVGKTKAWQNGHVVYLDGVALYLVGGGATALKQTVDQLNTALAK
jgi:iron complex transport system substrate-binding protein